MTKSSVNPDPGAHQHLKDGIFLVVDDHDLMRKITTTQLKALGAVNVLEATNGVHALEVLADTPVTMVLSDWNMPVMSGMELLTSLRSNPKFSALPFLMITAETDRAYVLQAIEAGVSDLLVKPYTPARLSERIARALTQKPRTVRAALPASSAGAAHALATGEPTAGVLPAARGKPSDASTPRKRRTILVVDDTPDNLHLLSSLFQEEYRVKVAIDGEKALAVAQSDSPPDLILLDVMMPGMDGFEVAERLRTHPASEHIPVIFVTAMTAHSARMKGLELGAVDFVTKPIDPDTLKVRVKNFMRYIDLHRQLQDDYDTIMATERLKEDVERITRHDMKAPLAGVIGVAQGLVDASNLTDDQREQLRMVEETTLQVLDMINLSNELYKIETGRFELDPKPVQVERIIRRIADMQMRAFAAKHLCCEITTPADGGDKALLARGDEMLSYSLFQNLIKNACEAAPAHSALSITLSAGEVVRVAIRNRGVVPESIRATFFEKFATAGKAGGTGLGTYSARLLAQAQNGQIGMETSDTEGATTVTVTLPS